MALLLKLEYLTTDKAAKVHVASFALERGLGWVKTPAVISVVSALNHDAEALSVLSERIKQERYSYVL